MKPRTLLTVTILACAASAGSQPVKGPGGMPMEKRLEEQLQLTPEQKSQVEAILRKQRERIRAVRRGTRRRLKEVLTAAQWEQFQAMHRRRMERRRRQFGPERNP